MAKKYEVRITQHAQNDLQQIFDYIAADNPKNAANFVSQLEKKLYSLNAFPARHMLIPENEFFGTDYRHLIHRKYRIIYRITEHVVFILRIVHGTKILKA